MVRFALLVRAGGHQHQTRRLAVAANSDARARAGRADVAGDGDRHSVDDHDWQRFGAWPGPDPGRLARSAGAVGAERSAATAPHTAVPPGLAVAAGATDPAAAAAAATPAAPRTLARHSRTLGRYLGASESPMLCL